MPHCDECGTPVSSSDRNFYGGGAYCEEHHPDPGGENCGECGARLAAWESPDRTVGLAMQLIYGSITEIGKVRDWSTNDLGLAQAMAFSISNKAADVAAYIDHVLEGRRDAEIKNKAAAEGHATGKAAFADGKMRAPYLDDSLRYSLKHYDPQYHEQLFTSWLEGWDSIANLATVDKPSPI